MKKIALVDSPGMKLYFMPHGIAVDRAEVSAAGDAGTRTLAREGAKRIRKAAALDWVMPPKQLRLLAH